MKLQVLLNAAVPAWLQILDQEKISYAIWEEDSVLPVGENRYPVLILTKKEPRRKSMIQAHLKQGGAVIVDLDTRSEVREQDFPGRIFSLDISIADICESWASRRKDFFFNGFTVSETVAAQKKSRSREVVRCAVQKAFWCQGLPYVHLWYYPRGYRSVFSFRFDMDEYDPDGHSAFCRLLEKYRGSVSCFACLKTFESLEDELGKVVRSGVEVGYHGYIHHIYQDYAQNKLDFEQAERLLQKHPRSVKSFAGPHGVWHPTLQRILEERNYIYSSEFGLDYDNFPFFPIVHGKTSSVTQIPTHPVCEGAFFERYPYQESMLRDYFNAVIDHKIRKEEPALLFGHPDHRIGRHPEIFTNIMEKIDEYQGVWKTEFRQWAGWWKKRHDISFLPQYGNGTVRIEGLERVEDCTAEILFQDGRREFSTDWFLPIFDKAKSDCVSPVVETLTQQSYFKKIKFGLKNWLDWETKTPPELLRITGVRTLVKRVFRALAGCFMQKAKKI
ncbi:MAG: polysaccharide deacetylase family protein [Candidatus Omnitrophota bacterium]